MRLRRLPCFIDGPSRFGEILDRPNRGPGGGNQGLPFSTGGLNSRTSGLEHYKKMKKGLKPALGRDLRPLREGEFLLSMGF